MRRHRRKSRLGAVVAVLSSLSATPLAAAEVPLPDGETTRAGGVTARLVDPTDRYDHGVLGDAIEAGGMEVEIGGRVHHLRLGPDRVFEDLRVRLVDLDGDGAPEALVIETDLKHGTALAAYRLSDRGIEPLATSEPTGQPHRWLNPVGVADFAGTGTPLAAAVVTPHVAGSLRFYRLQGKTLAEVGRLDGVTDHIAGTRNLDLSCIVDADGDGVADVVLPSRDRTALVAVSFAGGKAVERRRSPVSGRISALACRGGAATASLDDGRRVVVDLRTGAVSSP
ncbi:MAG: hypothetical protein GX458_14560 [Phyllobacteriaceae bacterium]|nr:hypothetical protein [Phyllobacteriaceae bacterium]